MANINQGATSKAPPSLEEQDVVVIEEDWSQIMTSDPSAFAEHETQRFELPGGTTIQIASTASLSPLDMMDLSNGTHDATGHRIWMGAKLWIHALPALRTYFEAGRNTCRCLELGSGTGLAGIATFQFYRQTIPIELVLTDSSESALELCRLNCRQNGMDEECSKINVQPLKWGSALPFFTSNKFDIIMATDVIYDIDAWLPLLETVMAVLECRGYLLVSHVPRAALPHQEEERIQDATPTYQSHHRTLEAYLIEKATDMGLTWKTTLLPKDLDSFPGQMDMQNAGAAILVFQRGPGDEENVPFAIRDTV